MHSMFLSTVWTVLYKMGYFRSSVQVYNTLCNIYKKADKNLLNTKWTKMVCCYIFQSADVFQSLHFIISECSELVANREWESDKHRHGYCIRNVLIVSLWSTNTQTLRGWKGAPLYSVSDEAELLHRLISAPSVRSSAFTRVLIEVLQSSSMQAFPCTRTHAYTHAHNATQIHTSHRLLSNLFSAQLVLNEVIMTH